MLTQEQCLTLLELGFPQWEKLHSENGLTYWGKTTMFAYFEGCADHSPYTTMATKMKYICASPIVEDFLNFFSVEFFEASLIFLQNGTWKITSCGLSAYDEDPVVACYKLFVEIAQLPNEEI